MLNAIGLANVGLDVFLAEKLPALQPMIRSGVAVFVNVAGRSPEDYIRVTQALAALPIPADPSGSAPASGPGAPSGPGGLAGIELNISCPNVKQGGISFGTDPLQVERITRTIREVIDQSPAPAGRRLRLMVKLSPNVSDIAASARAAIHGGADILSLVNTFTALSIDVWKRAPRIANGTGGLSGPGIRPIAVAMVSRVYREAAKAAGIPIVGLGGICTWQDAAEFILAGASAVMIGTALFVEPATPTNVRQGLADWTASLNARHISELVGTLELPGDSPTCAQDPAYANHAPANLPPDDL